MTNDTRPTIADVARPRRRQQGTGLVRTQRPCGRRRRDAGAHPAVAARHGVQPQPAGALAERRSGVRVRLVIGRSPDVIAADPFFPSFIAGVEDEFSISGQVLVLAAATPGRHEEDTYRGLVADRRVDGVILSDLRADDPRIALVAELGIAAVTLGVPDVPSPFTSVSVDDGAGIRLAVDHLADLGHTDIAHVAGPAEMLHGRSRTAAFERAAAARGIRSRVVATDFSARRRRAGDRCPPRCRRPPDRDRLLERQHGDRRPRARAASWTDRPARPVDHRIRRRRDRPPPPPGADQRRHRRPGVGRERRPRAAAATTGAPPESPDAPRPPSDRARLDGRARFPDAHRLTHRGNPRSTRRKTCDDAF